jgi:hypothetical protein
MKPSGEIITILSSIPNMKGTSEKYFSITCLAGIGRFKQTISIISRSAF